MWIVKSNVSSVLVVGPSSERNKFHGCFSLTKDLRSKLQGTQLWRLRWNSLCARRGNMKLETTAVFLATWMCVTLTESWDDRTCSVVVIWTRRNWQLAEHPRCDETRERRKHARGKNIRGEKREEMNPLSSYSSHACHQSRVACSVVSTFSERHAYSRCTEDRRYFKFQITAHCKFNMKHHIKHTEDYQRRQSWPPGVETLDFTIRICSTQTLLYFDLYLQQTQQTFIYSYVYFITITWIEKEQNII